MADEPLPPNFVGFPLPGFCVSCGIIVARTYAMHNGIRLCRRHLRERMREALWPDIPPQLRDK